MHIGVERNLDQRKPVDASRVLSPARGRALAAPSPPFAAFPSLTPRRGSPGHPAGDPGLTVLNEAVRLAFVGDERVLLAVAAQVDTLAELLHRSEVLDPVRVDRSEKDPSLDRAGELLAELFLARFVCLLDDLRAARVQLVRAA